MSKRKPRHKGPARAAGRGKPAGRDTWIYGRHAALAALANPARQIKRIAVTANATEGIRDAASRPGLPAPETIDRRALDALLPRDAVHQGLAVLAAPLAPVSVEDVADQAAESDRATVLVLDQATDPHNIGAVLRSAAAFGARAVIVQERNAPEATGALAKAASGALEKVPLVEATNIARALDLLKDAGFWCLGLDGETGTTIAEADLSGRVALVLGAEGAGLRRLVRETCDLLVRIPIQADMESLNISNAAAVALYESVRRREDLHKLVD